MPWIIGIDEIVHPVCDHSVGFGHTDQSVIDGLRVAGFLGHAKEFSSQFDALTERAI
jgi:hypothetical protein